MENDGSITIRGASLLLNGLQAVWDAAKTVQDHTAHPRMSNFMEIIRDLMTVVQAQHDISTRQQYSPSIHRASFPHDTELLQSVLRCTTAALEECNGSIQPLPSIIESQARHRNETSSYGSSIQHQAWYEAAYPIALLYNHVLASLLSSIHLLHGAPNTGNTSKDNLSRKIRFHINCAEGVLEKGQEHRTHAVCLSTPCLATSFLTGSIILDY